MSTLTMQTPLSEIGTLYTIGYAHPDAAVRVEHLMRNERTLLLDIRYSPRSRWLPSWNRAALAARYGQRYVWEQRLGNVNYQHPELGIKLADGHREAVSKAATLLTQGTSLVLLCACKHEQTCHRSLVAKLIQDAVQALREEAQGGRS